MENADNKQLNLIIHAELGRSDVHTVLTNIIKKEMVDVLRQTYDINRLCRTILIEHILQNKLADVDAKIIEAVRVEAQKICDSDQIAKVVQQKLTGYGSNCIDKGVAEMQPYINGRVAEAIKSADIKDIMNVVSDKISQKVFYALSNHEE